MLKGLGEVDEFPLRQRRLTHSICLKLKIAQMGAVKLSASSLASLFWSPPDVLRAS
jgi:hypothetical protein